MFCLGISLTSCEYFLRDASDLHGMLMAISQHWSNGKGVQGSWDLSLRGSTFDLVMVWACQFSL
jgi:hypothetical protein